MCPALKVKTHILRMHCRWMHEGLPLPLCLLVGRQASAKGTTLKFSSDEVILFLVLKKKTKLFLYFIAKKASIYVGFDTFSEKYIFYFLFSKKMYFIAKKASIYVGFDTFSEKYSHFLSCSPKNSFCCVLLRREPVFYVEFDNNSVYIKKTL